MLKLSDRIPTALVSARDLLATITLGLCGFGLNQMTVDLGWGNHLLLGSAISLLGLRLLPPLPASLAISIAALTTILRWGHPWAWLVWTIEGVCLAFTVKRASPILIDFAFWVLVGGPLIYLFYGGLLAMDTISVQLVIAKQALNGLLNVWLAESIYLFLLIWPAAARWLRLQPMPTPAFVMAALTAVVLVPLPFYLWLDGKRQEDALLSTNTAATQQEIARFQDRFASWIENRSIALRVLAADIRPTDTENLPEARLGPLLEDFGQIDIYSADGRLLGHYPPNTTPIEYNTRELPWLAARHSWHARVNDMKDDAGIPNAIEIMAVEPGSGTTIYAQMRNSRLLELVNNYSLGSDAALALVSPRGGVLTVIGAAPQVDFVLKRLQANGSNLLSSLKETGVLAPRGFGQTLMTHMQGAVLAASAPLLASPDGPWIVAFRILKPAIAEARAIQLQLLMLQWLFLSISIIGAAIISYLIGTRLQLLLSFASQFVSSSQPRPAPRDHASILKEVGDIGYKVDQLGGMLSTERQEAKNFQARLDTIQRHVPIVIYEVEITNGARGRIRWVSESLQRVFGYEQADGDLASWWSARRHPADAQAVIEKFSNLRPGQDASAEYRLRHKNGTFRWVYDVLLVSDQLDVDGTLRGNGFVIDVTQRKQSELQLFQASKLSSLGTMATGVAHELNQPLNVIKIGASNLLDDLHDLKDATEDHFKQVNVIIGQVDRAAQLINHMRVFSRRPIEPVGPLTLSSVRTGLRSLIATQLSSEGIKLSFDLADELPEVLGHAVLLEQVLLNIVLNARDAIRTRQTHSRPPDGEIRIEAKSVGDEIVIIIEDNGTGIPTEVLDHVFEPFFTTKEIGKGTGLGLSVSYGIVQDMGGSLKAETIDSGARFVITLPAAKKHALIHPH